MKNDDELNRARRYILDNPARWTIDENNWPAFFMTFPF
jgi:hypothetical protein